MSEKKRTVDEIKEIDELENFLSGCGESNIECISNWLTQDQIREVAEQLWDAGYRKLRVGEWENILANPRAEMLNAYHHICSECHYFYKSIRPEGHAFCCNCGAKMEGGAE